MPIRKWMTLFSAVTCSLMGCGESQPPAEPRVRLRVPLYSYIPDAAGDQFQALAQRLESEFEQQHPDVDLVVNPSCFKDDLYEPSELARSLRGESDCAYDVVETDTSLLGELVETGAVRPWAALPQGPQWHPAGISASTFQNQLYGVPHWLCAHYILSRNEAVSSAQTVDALVQALDALQTPAMNLAANLLGSWNLPSLYLDAWTDTHGPGNVQSAVSTQYDAQVLAGMKALTQGCETAQGNPCIDGTYDAAENFDLPTHLFADGQADATLGYSERLHTLLKRAPSEATQGTLRISLAPLGQGNQPLVFTDSFFLGKNCTGDCEQAAVRFVEYMSQASTYAWLLLSEDAPAAGRVPRYLMPAALDVYETPGLKADPFYPRIGAATRTAAPFPNRGLLNIRKQMRDDILRALSGEG
ncbi:extracellular solute-binding protein [Stigmatella sp. ncwal1]|uniref:Extracellular solute-binding protein n=1 Tax=Stigmatella ashevillensis TaxID=2995309 RepID=A0ABT5DDM3_9BACT|nr:extracellular solute-binding protein [Stigmatella ashevillena]MDC0711245.1 extracellular solute-binding protein [Stigmatella ashevillena]